MKKFHLTNGQARHVILHLQGLTRPHHRAMRSGELYEIVNQLGYVQQDSIRWMERAHHMTLFARNRTYRPKQLEKLHESGALFENWTHDASLIPSQFWKYWKHKFSSQEKKLSAKFINWQGEGFLQKVDGLKTRVKDDGILRSRDLEKPKGVKLDMWQWHDGKAALEFLWRTGQLAVPKREGFQKCYDLSERVLPPDCYAATCSEEAFVDWACRSALDRLGFGTAKEIADYWDLLPLSTVKDWLETHGAQETVNVTVDPVDKSEPKVLVARHDLGAVLASLDPVPTITRLLSPFDPVIRNRKRLSWLFGFDYTIEIYVPPEKRKYGYYIFPLLERDQLIGRVDCQADRKANAVRVSKVWLEPKVKWSKAKQERFLSELQRQARLCGVSKVRFEPEWEQF